MLAVKIHGLWSRLVLEGPTDTQSMLLTDWLTDWLSQKLWSCWPTWSCTKFCVLYTRTEDHLSTGKINDQLAFSKMDIRNFPCQLMKRFFSGNYEWNVPCVRTGKHGFNSCPRKINRSRPCFATETNFFRCLCFLQNSRKILRKLIPDKGKITNGRDDLSH